MPDFAAAMQRVLGEGWSVKPDPSDPDHPQYWITLRRGDRLASLWVRPGDRSAVDVAVDARKRILEALH
jgi:hypothetical protein